MTNAAVICRIRASIVCIYICIYRLLRTAFCVLLQAGARLFAVVIVVIITITTTTIIIIAVVVVVVVLRWMAEGRLERRDAIDTRHIGC